MYRWLSTYFGFSRTELYGISTLLVLVSLLWVSPYIYRFWIGDTVTISESDLQAIRDFEASRVVADQPWQTMASSEVVYEPMDAVEYFDFDPNGLAVVDWKRLGLSERQISVIKNYEAKGGRFRQASDLQKIYSISDADYERLAPYIRIAEPVFETRTSRQVPAVDTPPQSSIKEEVATRPARPVVSLELNSVDSLDLQQLPGIGPVFASRIVRFRDRLGGFYDTRQLLDVYGFDEERYRGLESQVYVDASDVSRIDINQAEYEQLVAHPFISPKQANAIIRYRKQHGPYQQVEDLLEIVTIDDEIFRKIAPYLTVSYD